MFRELQYPKSFKKNSSAEYYPICYEKKLKYNAFRKSKIPYSNRKKWIASKPI